MGDEYLEPAFPCPEDWRRDSGMSLRDYFAARAMHHFIALHPTEIWNKAMYGDGIEGDIALQTAKVAYCMADAMLKARNHG